MVIKESEELDENYHRKQVITNIDSDEMFGPATREEVQNWAHSWDIIENLGIFESKQAAFDAGDNFNKEVRAKYIPKGYMIAQCSMNMAMVNNILEEEEERSEMPTPEQVNERLKQLFNGKLDIQEIEDEDDCEIHNFMKKDDDDEPTLN